MSLCSVAWLLDPRPPSLSARPANKCTPVGLTGLQESCGPGSYNLAQQSFFGPGKEMNDTTMGKRFSA